MKWRYSKGYSHKICCTTVSRVTQQTNDLMIVSNLQVHPSKKKGLREGTQWSKKELDARVDDLKLINLFSL